MYIDKEYVISADLLQQLIGQHKKGITRWNKLYNYFIGKHEAIAKRYSNSYRNPQKLVVNHAKYITEIATSYLIGKKIDYESEFELEPILDKFKKQSINDLDIELATSNSWGGRALDYTYVNENSEIKTVEIDVRNGFVVRDDTVEHNKLFGLFFDEDKSKFDITLADSEKVYEYSLVSGKLTLISEREHFLGGVPFVEYRNNPEEQGDFEQVLSLIDAYDFLQSDRVNDKEQLVDAILKLKGCVMDNDAIESLKEHRVLQMASDEDAEYLVKTLHEADVEVLKSSIEKDIHKIAMIPNMSDENFANNISGVAMKFKLLAFEQLTIKKERYFEKSLKERFALYNYYLNIKENMPIVPLEEVDVKFTRNLPINDLEIAQMITQLQGIVDDETLIQRLSFVDDASQVIDKVEEKKRANMEQYVGRFDIPEGSEEEE